MPGSVQVHLSWQTSSDSLLTVSLQELTLKLSGRSLSWTVANLSPVVGAGVAGVLEIRPVDAGGVVTGGGNFNKII